MKRFFNKLANMTIATLGNTLLITSGIAMTMCAVGLTAFYLVKYIDRSSPDMIDFQCSVLGIEREECPEHQDNLNALQQELDRLQAQKAQMEEKLGTLRRISESVDSVTLFKMVDIDGTGMKVVIGTVYKDLLQPNPTPTYFCYIDLTGVQGIARNLYVRNNLGDVDITDDMLSNANITKFTEHFARAHCKPYLIVGGTV